MHGCVHMDALFFVICPRKETDSKSDCKVTLGKCHWSKEQAFIDVRTLLAASLLTELKNKKSEVYYSISLMIAAVNLIPMC